MIKSLKIKNFILIENVDLEFSPNLNIITGETGSGKSMLIDALITLFGGRASSDFVRNGESKAIIESEITHYSYLIDEILNQNEIECNTGSLIIRREISAKGQSRNFINDSPVNLNTLKDIGSLLIDFHGQHEHQSLLNSLNHIKVLDGIGDYNNLLNDFKKSFTSLQSKLIEFNQTIKKEKEIKDKISFQKFVLDEINKLNPCADEDIQIESELKLLENAEFISVISDLVFEDLYGKDDSIFTQLNDILQKLEKLRSYNLEINTQIDEINSSIITSKEVATHIKNISNLLEFNPDKIESLRTRFNQLKGLQKKYGTISELLDLKKKIEEELKFAESFSDKISQLKTEYEDLQNSCGILAAQLSELRKHKALHLASEIEESLKTMGINWVDFQSKISSKEISIDCNSPSVLIGGKFWEVNEYGIDKVEFYISTNKGQDAKPLSEVASGGEISRIMLALKNIISKSDTVDTMVFDEIDTGISGRIAQMVGAVMKKISSNKQLLTITHLAQIAAFGDMNVIIKKIEKGGNEVSIAEIIEPKNMPNEIAKMISGETVSDNTIKSAMELINYSKQ